MKKLSLLFLITFLCLSKNGFAQKKRLTVQQAVDSIVLKKPTTYKGISNYLRQFRRDTIKLKKLIILFKEKNYLDGKTYAENFLGRRYRKFSLYNKAITIHKQALTTSKKAKNIEFQVFSLNMLGVDYREKDAIRVALDYNQEALVLAESVKNPNFGLRRSIAVSHNSMGNIYLLLKQYDLAINQFLQSQVIEKSIHNKLGLAINNQNIGYAYDAKGELDKALEYYQKSLVINNTINNSFGKIICNSSIANIYIKQGKPKDALVLIEENFPIVKKLGNKKYLAFEYLNFGWAQTKLKQYKKAERNLLKGLKIAKTNNLISTLSTAYSHLYELKNETKNYKDALSYYTLAEEFDEKISNERNTHYVNDLIIKYDSEKKNNQIKTLAKENEISKLQLSKNRVFWIISLSLLLLTGIILYTLYKHKLLKNKQKITTLEQDALRAQMNPHFIFNALNSIKLYIINNEQKNAVHYLNKFSKLIRKILEVSAIKETSLAQELETMDLYMTIENIRFSNEIDFNMNVKPTLNLGSIKVPPLVLQPFLENAIWHGLSSKKGEKKITLSVNQTHKNFIEITIEDNGIGRKASAKIKAGKTIHRKSIGIALTKDRLKNFVKEHTHNFSLTYTDLMDKDNHPKGTQVSLLIPLK